MAAGLGFIILGMIRFTQTLAAVICGGCGYGDATPGPPPPAPPPPGVNVALQTVGNFAFPVFLTAPAGDARLFVVEKRGTIRVVKQGTTLAAPFLDLTARVSSGGEQGLLGLAFHPGYASNGLFVVNYTETGGATRVALYRVGADPDRADPASEQIILSSSQPFSNHNGGMVAFGPDGHLYIGTGDGGSGGDPQGNGQRLNTLLGKLLRVAVSATGQVSVPPDNPFISRQGAAPEIWSLGLRNPWRFSFDRATGDLYIGDVGQNQHEEIDAVTGPGAGRGLNFGWNVMEGLACFNASSCNQQGLTLPVLDYPRADGCSVTGGYVYRGAAVPALVGHYLYSDYCQGWVRSFRFAGGAATDRREWSALATSAQVTSFGEDAAGELYLLTAGGRVARIVSAP